MKVTIFGSYNGGSIGDTAILVGLVSSISRVLGDDAEVTVLTLGDIGLNNELDALGLKINVREVQVNCLVKNRFFVDRSYLNKAWRYWHRLHGENPLNKGCIRRVLRDSDIFLIGGGNLIMDMFENWPKILSAVCELSKKYSVPYHFVGVGAGPINTLPGKDYLDKALASSSGVYFRDLASKDYCNKHLGFEKSSVGPDLAFGIDCSQLEVVQKIDILMLNIAAVFSSRWPVKDPNKYDAYLSNMVLIVDDLVNQLKIKKLVLFNTNYPLDEFAAEDFLVKYKKNSRSPVDFELIRGRNTVAKILNECGKAKFSLVTRLHAGILSTIAGAKVLAIEYQPKVRDVLKNQTSHTEVESFESVLSGEAFKEIDRGSLLEKSITRKVGMNDVDEMLEKILKSGL